MRKLAALVLCGMMAIIPAAQAQPASPPAESVETPSESRIAAAIELLKATNAIDAVSMMLDSIMPMQRAEIRRAAPGLSEEAANALLARFNGAMLARQDELLRLYGIEYARHFSEQELRELTAFYQTDVGKKYIMQVPTLYKNLLPVISRWMAIVVQQELQEILKSLPQQERKT